MSGKGDAPRPRSVSEDEYAERWGRTFMDRRTLHLPLHERTDLGYRLAALICRAFGHRVEERVTGRFRCTRCLRWEP